MICSTEKRFFFTARPPGRLARLCRKTHPGGGLKNPEPLRPIEWPSLNEERISSPRQLRSVQPILVGRRVMPVNK